MADQKDIECYLANWSDERNSAAMYQALAEAEENTKLAQVYHRLSDTEQRHAEAWAERIQAAGAGEMAGTESRHARLLRQISQSTRGGMEGGDEDLDDPVKASSPG